MRLLLSVFALLVALPSPSRSQSLQPLEPECPPARDTFHRSVDPRIPASVVGEITDRDSARPIRDGFVAITPGDYRAGTDSLGGFRIARVPEGRYDVQVRAIGFAAYNDTLTVNSRGGVRLHVPLVPQYFERCPTVRRSRVDQPVSHRKAAIVGGIVGGVVGGLAAAGYILNATAYDCITTGPPCPYDPHTKRRVIVITLGAGTGATLGAWIGRSLASFR